MNRKIKMGMVGGGRGGSIGVVHQMAARLDGQIELVCGAFSCDPEKSRLSGQDLYLPPQRVYKNYEELFTKEKALPQDERMDFVTIVTPNDLHFPIAKAAIENGFNVVCDKPVTLNLAEARKLAELVAKNDVIFMVSYNYTGYPLVKEARQMISEGKLGEIRKVVVEYSQGWLSATCEEENWRTDAGRAGISCCIADIGVHAQNLAEYITDLKIEKLCADLTAFGQGRKLDDDGNILIRFAGGARGILYASQISAGEENNLKIRVYGEKAGLQWQQVKPNELIIKWLNKPTEVIRAGADYEHLSKTARYNCRLDGGHPEGFIEAFANLYRNFALALRCQLNGEETKPECLDFPTIEDGVCSMAFTEAVVESAKSNNKWNAMPEWLAK